MLHLVFFLRKDAAAPCQCSFPLSKCLMLAPREIVLRRRVPYTSFCPASLSLSAPSVQPVCVCDFTGTSLAPEPLYKAKRGAAKARGEHPCIYMFVPAYNNRILRGQAVYMSAAGLRQSNWRCSSTVPYSFATLFLNSGGGIPPVTVQRITVNQSSSLCQALAFDFR